MVVEYSKLVSLRRHAKVVKKGRIFSFKALVIVGDKKGSVGIGSGKALDPIQAQAKATRKAKRNMVKIPLKENRTIHHDALGQFGAAQVFVRSAPPGKGIIVGGIAARAVLEGLGIQDIVVKSLGSSNEHNIVRALMDALTGIASPKQISEKRGFSVSEMIQRRDMSEQKVN